MTWPMRNRRSNRTAHVQDKLSNELTESWNVYLRSSSLAPPITSQDNIYIAAVDVVWAVNKSSGESLWRFDCLGNESERLNGFKASPITINGFLFVADMQGNAYKFDAVQGALIKTAYGIGASDESFCVYDGHLFSRFVSSDGDKKRYGYARLNFEFEPIWSFYGEGPYSTTSCAIDEGKVIYGDRTGFLYCLDVDSGNEIWRADVKPHVSPSSSPYARKDPIPVGMPIINRSLIIVRCGNDIIGFDLGSSEHRWTIRPAEGLEKPAPADCLATDDEYLYFTANGAFRKVALSTGEFVLTTHHDSLGLSRAMDGIVVGDHYLAGFNESHTLAIINTKSGEIDAHICSDAGFRSAPIWDDGSIYAYDDLARLRKYSGAK